MRNYELAYIVHPDLENTLEKVTDRINKFINANGKIVNEDIWGKRKLAYQIRKQNFGLYVIVNMELEPVKVSELEALLRIIEEVIRFAIISIDVEAEAKVAAKKEKKKEEHAARKEEIAKNIEETEPEKVEKEEKAKEVKKISQIVKKPEKPKKDEDETERLKELDEKLKAILGDEEK